MMRSLAILFAAAFVSAVTAGERGPQLKLRNTLEGGHPIAYAPVVFSPDGKTLAASDFHRDADAGAVKLWDVNKGKVIATLGRAVPGSPLLGPSLFFNPDGKTFFVGGAHVTLWDVATLKEKATFKDLSALAFSRDGKTAAAISKDRVVTLWDLSTGHEKADLKGHEGAVFSVAFSPDGRLIAIGCGTSASNGQPAGGEVKVWDVATGRERATLRGRIKVKVTSKSLAYLRTEGVPQAVLKKLAGLDGMEFVTEEDFEREIPKVLEKILDKGQRKKFLDLVRLEIRPVSEGGMVWVWSVAFSPDSKTLASTDVLGNIFLWDVQSGKRTATMQAFNPRGREEDINGAFSVAYSPDGTTLAAGTRRGIKLWDVKSGKPGIVQGPEGTVWSVAFSPDGKTIASAGSKRVIGIRDRIEDDPVLRVWELVPVK